MHAKFNGRFGENYLLFLDGDNIRGKSGFLLGKEDLVKHVTRWSRVMENAQNMALIYDHGPQHMAHLLEEEGIAIVFSGPGRTADDVIANAIQWCQTNNSSAIVVTADSGLKGRCKKNIAPSSTCDVVTIDSNTFIDMLESIENEDVDLHKNKHDDDEEEEVYLNEIDFDEVKGVKEDIDIQVALARKRLSLQNQLVSLNKLISNNKGTKKTKKLKLRREELSGRLHRITFKENITSDKVSSNPDNDYLATYLQSKHNQRKYSKERRGEETWERVVLAERMHCELFQRSLVVANAKEDANVKKIIQQEQQQVNLEPELESSSIDRRDEEDEVAGDSLQCSKDKYEKQKSKHLKLLDVREEQPITATQVEKMAQWSRPLLNYCININSMVSEQRKTRSNKKK